MKKTLTLTVLSCIVLAFAPANVDGFVQRRLRHEEDYTTPEPDTPLDSFRAAIQKVKKHEDVRKLRDDDQEALKNFVMAIKKFTGKDGHFRRTEEKDDTEHHVDYLLGRINGREMIKPKTDE